MKVFASDNSGRHRMTLNNLNTLTQPLTESEIAHLDAFLYGLNHRKAMTLEKMDGFFCALICYPDPVPLSEYLPLICGGDPVQGGSFKTIEEAQRIINLLARHWKTISETLLRDVPHAVFIERGNENDGEDWAHGFELGMSLRADGWNRFINDDRFAVALVPIVVLAEARNLDSGLPPMTPEIQEEAIGALSLSVLTIYRFFRNASGNILEGEGEQGTFRLQIVQ